MVREDTESKRIDPDAPASQRLGDADSPQYLNLVGKSQLAGLTLDGSPAAGDWLLTEDPTSGLLQRVNWSSLPGAGGGEINTASNQGTDGVGVYDTKVGVDLQFRNIAPASSKLSVTLNLLRI
jgi:hypothetical protein